jgi:hypothetical protein
MKLDLTGIGSIASLIETGVNKIWPDKTEQEKAKFALLSQELSNTFQLALNQINTNIEEAKSKSVFVAGWRPFVGWVSGTALAYSFVLQPFLVWTLSAFGINTELPKLQIEELMTLLFGMLGLGAMRSYDKMKSNGGA